MRRHTGSCLSFVFMAIACSTGLGAQSPVTVTAELGVKDTYLFAGIPFAAAEVTQASVAVGAGSLTVNGVGLFDHDRSRVTEAHLWADYYVQVSPLIGTFAGAAFYSFRIGDSWESTPEIYAGAVLSTPLSPTLYVAHDLDLGDGTHATFSLSHTVPLGPDLSLDLSGELDYNDGYYTSISGLSYASIGASLDIGVGPVQLRPLMVLQAAIDDTFTDETVFGITAAYTF